MNAYIFQMSAAYVFIDSLDRMARTIPHQVRQNYDISRQLGFGAFGEVVLVFHKVSAQNTIRF